MLHIIIIMEFAVNISISINFK